MPDSDLRLLEIDQHEEINTKLSSWRKAAVTGYPARESRVWRVVSTQKHLDETADNDNRKRLLQRRQLVIYLGSLVAALLAICILEFVGRGLILAEGSVDGWWLVAAVLYGTLGGAFSSAQRVAAAGPAARFPELRWAQFAEYLPTARGRCAARWLPLPLSKPMLSATPLGSSGPRVALVCFVAGFSERFIPSLAAQQLPAK